MAAELSWLPYDLPGSKICTTRTERPMVSWLPYDLPGSKIEIETDVSEMVSWLPYDLPGSKIITGMTSDEY